MKSWNWTLFVVMLCVAELGALSNKNIDSTGEAVLFGLICGVLIGFPLAYLTRGR